jgi:hypothetical protein
LALVKFLGTAKFKVDWNVFDGNGLTPLMIAGNLGVRRIEQQLKSFGAIVHAPPPSPPPPPPPAADVPEPHKQIQGRDAGDPGPGRKHHRKHRQHTVQGVEGEDVSESQAETVHEGGD